jgi:SNF2 family DNA or RNA helicase
MKVDIVDGKFQVEASPMQAALLKAVPGAKFDAKLRVWRFPLGYPAWIAFHTDCRALITEYSDAVIEFVEQSYEQETDLWNIRLQTPKGYWDQGLRPMQKQAVNWIEQADGSGVIGDDPGSGKTVMACNIIERDREYRDIFSEGPYRVLIVCPKSVFGVWEDHIRDWTTINPIVASDTAVRRRKAIEAWLQDGGALIINYQSLWRHTRLAPYGSIAMKRCPDHGGLDPKVGAAQCHVHEKELDLVRDIDYMVLDESHRIKDPKTNQARGIKWIAQKAANRLALTGTPIAKSPDHLWSVFNFVDPIAWPAKGQFLDRYCLMAENYATGGTYVAGLLPAHRDEFFRVRDLYLLRRDFATVVGRDIEKVYMTRTSYLTPKQRKVYNGFRDDALIELEGGTVFSESDLVATMRMLQASSATLDVDEEGNIKMVAPSPKVQEFYDWWNEDYDRQPFVVMAGGPGSRQLIELASDFLIDKGVRFSKVVGGMDADFRKEQVARYMDGEVDLFLGQTTAAGEGLNLDRGTGLGFLQRPWSFIETEQAENRIRRASQEADSILIVDFVTDDSFDQRILEIYKENKEMFDEVLRDTSKLKELL